MDTVELGNQRIGSGEPVFIIAEAGVNHNGRLDLARQLVDAAAASGADAVKFQLFAAERLVTHTAPKAAYQEESGGGDSQFAMLKDLELGIEEFHTLVTHARERGILFLCTPFSEQDIDTLVDLGVPALKIGSGEVTNEPYLRHAARTGLPLIFSTGMATIEEVARAVAAMRDEGCRHLVLLHCVSNYPARAEDANLRAMESLRLAFALPVGYSDHVPGAAVSVAAVALGACVIEKHFTLDRSLPGPDHQASLSVPEFTAFVEEVRAAQAALGSSVKAPTASEMPMRDVARRSIVATVPIPAGTVITRAMLVMKRPGTGLPPTALQFVLGRTARAAIAPDDLLSWEHI